MRIVLDGRTSGKRKRANKRLERFHTLRDRLERKKLAIARFDADMDSLMEVYRTQVLPVEAEEVQPLSCLAERLILFMGRKSLGNRDRDELAEWFWETESTIRAFQPELAAELANAFKAAAASYAGLTIEELDSLHEDYERWIDASAPEAHDGGDDDADLDSGPEQPDFFGFDDVFVGSNWDEVDELDEGDAFHAGPTAAASVDPDRLINGDWIRGIFRRTALALHPDRELDAAKREDKHTLMARLLEARKQEDVITILELHSEHVAGGELQVADAELDAICQLIQNRIDALEAEKQRGLYSNPTRHMVFELLHGNSKRARERKLGEFIRDIRARARYVDGLVGELRNLTCLREALLERRYAQNFDLMHEVEMLYANFKEDPHFRHGTPF